LWTPRHPPCTLSSLTTLFFLNSRREDTHQLEDVASLGAWFATTFPIHLVFKEQGPSRSRSRGHGRPRAITQPSTRCAPARCDSARRSSSVARLIGRSLVGLARV